MFFISWRPFLVFLEWVGKIFYKSHTKESSKKKKTNPGNSNISIILNEFKPWLFALNANFTGSSYHLLNTSLELSW